jgi:hypothetical protein
MKWVLYYGWLDHNNLGDEALFHANKQIFPRLRLVKYTSFLSRISPPTVCILGGGTYINEQVSVARIRAIQDKARFIIFGAGVQNPAFWSLMPGYVDARKEWNELLERSLFVGVRGPHSLKTLLSQGFHGAVQTGDPALYLAEEYRPKNRPGRRIGINFGDTSNCLWGADDAAVFKRFCDLLEALLHERYELSLFSTCPADTETLNRIGARFSIKEVRIHYTYTSGVLDYFRSLDAFVGMKLHSIILAHCAYTPALMIEYRPKCADYMASMGLEEYNFRCDQFTVPEVLGALQRLLAEGKAHGDFLFRKIADYREIQERSREEALSCIGRW